MRISSAGIGLLLAIAGGLFGVGWCSWTMWKAHDLMQREERSRILVGRLRVPSMAGALLDNKDIRSRLDIIKSLGETRTSSAAYALVPILDDYPDGQTQKAVEEALIEIGLPAVSAVIPGVQSKKSQFRDSAIHVLWGIHAYRELLPFLKDKDPVVRRLVAKRIYITEDSDGRQSYTKDTEVKSALFTALRERDLAVVSGAVYYFLKFDVRGFEDTIVDALDEWPDRYNAELLLNSGNSKLANNALWWAARMGYKTETVRRPTGPDPWGKP
jgi:hypothetical protein